MNIKIGWIVVAVVGVVILITAVFIFKAPFANNVPKNEEVEQTRSATLGSRHKIIMEDNKFVPGELTINVGDEVTFVNEDTDPHWPASGVHPTHLLCPGFDSLKGVAKGDAYSHVFEKPATCPMHDHMLPSMKGKIIVQ